jgi:hypothetical protein
MKTGHPLPNTIVTAPGVPKNYPDAKKLVTEDCIRPIADDRRSG